VSTTALSGTIPSIRGAQANRMPPVSEQEEKKQRIVREAAALMGHRELAGRLGISMEHVLAWIDGTAAVPAAILVQLSEVLVSWTGTQRFSVAGSPRN
jgi:hypothetical protein